MSGTYVLKRAELQLRTMNVQDDLQHKKNDENIQKVRKVIRSNCRLTVREVAEEDGISKATCHKILTFAVGTAWSVLFTIPRGTLCYISFRKVYTTTPTTSNYLFTTVLYRNFQRHTVKLSEKSEEINSWTKNDFAWMMHSAGKHKCTNKSHMRYLGSLFSFRGSTALVALGHLYEVPRSYSNPPHSVESLRTSYRSVAETFTWQQTTFTRHITLPPAGFELAMPASQRPQTYALHRATTGIGRQLLRQGKNLMIK